MIAILICMTDMCTQKVCIFYVLSLLKPKKCPEIDLKFTKNFVLKFHFLVLGPLLLWLRYLLRCGYAGSSLEVKIETDSNDAMEIKTEADSSTNCLHREKPSTGMFVVFCAFICLCVTWMVFAMLCTLDPCYTALQYNADSVITRLRSCIPILQGLAKAG